MRLGIISDTHNVLKDEILTYLKDCDYIIHAGDVGEQFIIDQLSILAKTFIVRGNNDKGDWGRQLPDYLEIELDNILIYVVHDQKDIPKQLEHVDLVIYGHSHKYHEEVRDGVIFLNPGGCGRRRFSLPLTMAVIELTGDNMTINKIELN